MLTRIDFARSGRNAGATGVVLVTTVVSLSFRAIPGGISIFPRPHAEFTTAFRNGSLQGAYLLLAARACGLDVGAMSGFDNAKVDAAFFPEGTVKSNFLCNLGYGDSSKLGPRPPRLPFEEACRII